MVRHMLFFCSSTLCAYCLLIGDDSKDFSNAVLEDFMVSFPINDDTAADEADEACKLLMSKELSAFHLFGRTQKHKDHGRHSRDVGQQYHSGN